MNWTTRVVQNLAGVPAQPVPASPIPAPLPVVPVGCGGPAYYYQPQLGGLWPQGGTVMVSDMSNPLRTLVGQLVGEPAAPARQMFASASAQSGPVTPSASAYAQGPTLGVVQVPGPVVQVPVPVPVPGPVVHVPVPGPVMQGSAPAPQPQPNGGAWWPSELGWPATTGSQNQVSYAYFPASRRLAVRIGQEVRIYDTGDHAIGGVFQAQPSQHQPAPEPPLGFTSQYGHVRLSDLPQVWPATNVYAPNPSPLQPPPAIAGEHDILAALEKLGALRDKNILSEDEFAQKKAELLSRL